MRCERDFFEEKELDLLFLARRLREALKVEMLLGEAEVDYYVETGPYHGGFLFPRELTGAYFYVRPADTERAKQLLRANRYWPFEKTTG